MNLNKYKKLSGDASFRAFYRKNQKGKSSIIVYCKKDKKSNLLIYDAINQILNQHKIKAPRLISQEYDKNLIEIEDLGNLTVYKNLRKFKNNKLFYFKKILKLLIKLQKIKKSTLKTFLNSNYKIPLYTKEKLFNESKLFIEWYLPKYIKGKNKNKIKKKLETIFKSLLNKLVYKKKVFVHRDFHVSNIMISKNSLGLIDTQDSVYGNVAYDIASLIDDVRFSTKISEKECIFSQFIKLKKSFNKNKLKNDFEILSVLRNLKIIGIFSRLSERDKKNQYLKLIPYAWKLIEYRINNNRKFLELKKILDKNFSEKIRKK